MVSEIYLGCAPPIFSEMIARTGTYLGSFIGMKVWSSSDEHLEKWTQYQPVRPKSAIDPKDPCAMCPDDVPLSVQASYIGDNYVRTCLVLDVLFARTPSLTLEPLPLGLVRAALRNSQHQPHLLLDLWRRPLPGHRPAREAMVRLAILGCARPFTTCLPLEIISVALHCSRHAAGIVQRLG